MSFTFFPYLFWIQVIKYKKILTTEDTFKIQCGDEACNEIIFSYNPKSLFYNPKKAVFAFQLYCFYMPLIFFFFLMEKLMNKWLFGNCEVDFNLDNSSQKKIRIFIYKSPNYVIMLLDFLLIISLFIKLYYLEAKHSYFWGMKFLMILL